jgi:hypothetical protein
VNRHTNQRNHVYAYYTHPRKIFRTGHPRAPDCRPSPARYGAIRNDVEMAALFTGLATPLIQQGYSVQRLEANACPNIQSRSALGQQPTCKRA